MRVEVSALLAACWIQALLAAPARADRVVLSDGATLEGKASRSGDQVVVQVGAGEIRVAAREVIRIERGDSDVQTFERRYAQLRPGDAKALLELADYCRERDMRERERSLLLKLIELQPDHAAARARLGYEREGERWMLREERLLAQGYVNIGGQWLSPQEQREREAANKAQRNARMQAEAQRRETRLYEAVIEAERQKAEAARLALAVSVANGPPLVRLAPQPPFIRENVPYTGVWDPDHCDRASCPRRSQPAPARSSSFPIAGARDPFDYIR